ncbi:putative caffeate O-methyltransferase [Medicago truncatula]|uniref:Putative caffeate O-methyltransferase n=1 Tax=Medicago truncatula TaxID=3880 RepID=A0A396GKD3_MEDTR|nr:putative caffeate O-methyltransferase [Medicago truncatula]
MINHTKIVMNKVLESYNGFQGIKRLVDVGGDLGVNINLITSKYHDIHGINFDLPHVIQHAPLYPGMTYYTTVIFLRKDFICFFFFKENSIPKKKNL